MPESPSESFSESPSASPSPDPYGSEYYVDASLPALSVGAGTEEDPWNYQQLRNYFNPALGEECNTYPVDGDEIYVKGIIDTVTAPIFSIGRLDPDVNVNIQAWDIAENGIWLIETFNIVGDVTFIKEEAGYRFASITMKGFGLLKSSAGQVNVLDLDATRTENLDIDFKNFMIYAAGNIIVSNNDYTDIFIFGSTIYSSGDVYLLHNSDTHFSVYDSIIKSTNIYEEL